MLNGQIIAVSIKYLKNSTQPHYTLTKVLPPQLLDSLSCDGGLAWQSAQNRPQPTTEKALRMRSWGIPEILMQQEVAFEEEDCFEDPGRLIYDDQH